MISQPPKFIPPYRVAQVGPGYVGVKTYGVDGNSVLDIVVDFGAKPRTGNRIRPVREQAKLFKAGRSFPPEYRVLVPRVVIGYVVQYMHILSVLRRSIADEHVGYRRSKTDVSAAAYGKTALEYRRAGLRDYIKSGLRFYTGIRVTIFGSRCISRVYLAPAKRIKVVERVFERSVMEFGCQSGRRCRL